MPCLFRVSENRRLPHFTDFSATFPSPASPVIERCHEPQVAYPAGDSSGQYRPTTFRSDMQAASSARAMSTPTRDFANEYLDERVG
jgi:hypothetical protein